MQTRVLVSCWYQERFSLQMMFSPTSLIASPESVGVWLSLSCVSATHRSVSALSRDLCYCLMLPREIHTERCGMGPLAFSQDVFGLVARLSLSRWWYFARKREDDAGNTSDPLSWRENLRTQHQRRGIIYRMFGRKLKKSRTLPTNRTHASPGFSHWSLVRSYLPKVTPSCTWFSDAGVHRYRSSYTRQNIIQLFPNSFEISGVHIQEECGPGLWFFPWATIVTFVVICGCLKSRQRFWCFHMPWTTVLSLAVSPWRRVQESCWWSPEALASAFENFMVTWPNSQEQGTFAERARYGDNRKSRYRRVPDGLEHEVDAWYSDA